MSAITQLIVNGCSYSNAYSSGGGHIDLAQRLNISKVDSLALGGSSNSRIIRTTLKHSYNTTEPTLYVLGITFLHRWELPVIDIYNNEDSFEGAWINPQSQRSPKLKYHPNWKDSDTAIITELHFKTLAHSPSELSFFEDLLYRLLSLAGDLRRRGHRVLFYNQVDAALFRHFGRPQFNFAVNNPIFVDGFKWLSIPWQQKQGAPTMAYEPGVEPPPLNCRHIEPGHHNYLNQFLTDYIINNNIQE
jgi:hypothetical protein